MPRWVRTDAKLVAILAIAAVGVLPALAGAATTPPTPQQFNRTAIAVVAGTKVAVHWRTTSGESFLLTSPPPSALPHFGTKSVTTWPTGSNATFSTKHQWWSTTSDAATFVIPSTAHAGTTSPSSCRVRDQRASLLQRAWRRRSREHHDDGGPWVDDEAVLRGLRKG